VAAEPGLRFAFTVAELEFQGAYDIGPFALWDNEFLTQGDGTTKVTEAYLPASVVRF